MQVDMSWLRSSLFVGSLLLYSQAASMVPRTWNGVDYECKCYHGDDCWPDEGSWSTLNQTVDGNLQVHVPPGAVCHNVRAIDRENPPDDRSH
jgi:hypothetical protein